MVVGDVEFADGGLEGGGGRAREALDGEVGGQRPAGGGDEFGAAVEHGGDEAECLGEAQVTAAFAGDEGDPARDRPEVVAGHRVGGEGVRAEQQVLGGEGAVGALRVGEADGLGGAGQVEFGGLALPGPGARRGDMADVDEARSTFPQRRRQPGAVEIGAAEQVVGLVDGRAEAAASEVFGHAGRQRRRRGHAAEYRAEGGVGAEAGDAGVEDRDDGKAAVGGPAPGCAAGGLHDARGGEQAEVGDVEQAQVGVGCEDFPRHLSDARGGLDPDMGADRAGVQVVEVDGQTVREQRAGKMLRQRGFASRIGQRAGGQAAFQCAGGGGVRQCPGQRAHGGVDRRGRYGRRASARRVVRPSPGDVEVTGVGHLDQHRGSLIGHGRSRDRRRGVRRCHARTTCPARTERPYFCSATAM
ncbi:Uncharacterised protein [Mycobacteroides abscessus subsp. abscessus]|nr:Uncharacterised protein [Mycobacteroides abscessus subsp. abscessus]